MTGESDKFENLTQSFLASKRPKLEITIPRKIVRILAVLDEYEGDQSVLWTARFLGELWGVEVMKTLIYDPRGLFLPAKDSYDEFVALIKEQRKIYEHYRSFNEVEMIIDPRVAAFFDKISEIEKKPLKKEEEKKEEEKEPIEAEIFGGNPEQELSVSTKDEFFLTPEMFQDLVQLLISPLSEGKGVMEQLMSIVSWYDPDLVIMSPPLIAERDPDTDNPLGEVAEKLLTMLPRDVMTLMVIEPLANLVKKETCFLYSPQKDDSIIAMLSGGITFLQPDGEIELVSVIDQQAIDAAALLLEDSSPEEILNELIKKQQNRFTSIRVQPPSGEEIQLRGKVVVNPFARAVQQIAEEQKTQLMIFSPRQTQSKTLDPIIASGIKTALKNDLPVLVVW